jgi:hypothetical protein|tara:strand:- start:847 stop:1251 length:405 start_codon:yes stop_codon:yes gene_type:complete
MYLETEIELLKNITAKTLFINVDSINVKQKTQEQVLARLVVCNVLMQAGITPATLAKHFCKHRTNFYHYRKLHNHYLQYVNDYPEYNNAFHIVLDTYNKVSTVGSVKRELEKVATLSDIDLTIAKLNNLKKQLA